ncbi:MAG: hypothetical protein RI988_1486 [Pseudomonadota bacterium]|jgi:hypothetical protein
MSEGVRAAAAAVMFVSGCKASIGLAEMAVPAETIPIVAAPGRAEPAAACAPCGACAGPQPVCAYRGGPAGQVPEPRLAGEAQALERVLAWLAPQMDDVFGHPVRPGVWLRSLTVGSGQAHMELAPDLACHAGPVGELAFDAMRRLLPDTDLYIGAAHG